MRNEIAQVLKQRQVMELVFGNSSSPKDILGRHFVEEGQVISTYHPDAIRMQLICDNGKEYEMDRIERQPVFALFLPTRAEFRYRIRMTFRDGNIFETEDPYLFRSRITKEEEEAFCKGTWKTAYEKLGCHPMVRKGVRGVYFAVWAPAARRVSVVGDFNFWNGLTYPMDKKEESGIFEIFIPAIDTKSRYKYEIKTMQGEVFQKSDPYGTIADGPDENASIILDVRAFEWKDKIWMHNRRNKVSQKVDFAICDIRDINSKEEVMRLVTEGYFTHVLLKAPAYGHGGFRRQVRNLINELHQIGIGVLIEIGLGYFPDEDTGLKFFDGSSLYGCSDGRIYYNESKRMYRFNHSKPEVAGALIANLMFWLREYHVDGFQFEEITQMLIPDLSNVGEEVLQGYDDIFYLKETEKFLMDAVLAIKEEDESVIVISDEDAQLSLPFEELFFSMAPFDYVLNYNMIWNMSMYFKTEADQRENAYFRLTNALMQSGLSKSIVHINPYDAEIYQDEAAMTAEERQSKRCIRKLIAGYLSGAPGKKCFVAREQEDPLFMNYIHKLYELYLNSTALSHLDEEEVSFEWINGMNAMSKVISFLRKSPGSHKNLLFVCNFDDDVKDEYCVGVPKYGEYRLILHSDWEEFGGKVLHEKQVLRAASKKYDLRPYSIKISIPEYSVMIFEY